MKYNNAYLKWIVIIYSFKDIVTNEQVNENQGKFKNKSWKNVKMYFTFEDYEEGSV